jgi:hypothetical protein
LNGPMDNSEHFSVAVDLSSDGSILAVASSGATEDLGVRVYQWTGERYAHLWNDTPSGTDAM